MLKKSLVISRQSPNTDLCWGTLFPSRHIIFSKTRRDSASLPENPLLRHCPKLRCYTDSMKTTLPPPVKTKQGLKEKEYLQSKKGMNTIFNEDCRTGLHKIQNGSAHLVVTDPPFAIDFNTVGSQYNRKSENVLKGYSEIKREDYFDFTREWLQACKRVLSENGSMFLVSGWSNLRDILNAVEDVGFETINHLIWKYQFGVFTKKKFVTSHYHILFLVKDKKNYVFNKIDHYPEDVLVIKRKYWANKVKTPTRLPEELVSKLIAYGSNENDVVLDPFMGSGTTAVCAKNMKRHYLGFEVVKEYVDFARKRVSGNL